MSNGRIPRPRDSEPGYAGDPSCGWGSWIEHDGGPIPEYVGHTMFKKRGDPVDWVGTWNRRGTGRNYAVDWSAVRWFRLRADHPHYD